VLLAALSDAQKTGIALTGAAFIVFALVSSLVIPRRWPNFPGRHVWAYVVVVIGFFAAMMSVIVFAAREQGKAEAKPPATSPSPSTSPAPAPPPPAGNAAAGKAVFTSAGCAACHTFKPAGSSGTTGPDLDKLPSDAQKANRGPLAQYVHESIVDPNAYVVPGFPAGVMPQNFGQSLKPQQLADLIAFLTQGASS